MKNQNICMFNQNRSSDLICTDFVYETNRAQSNKQIATQNILGFILHGEGVLTKDSKQYSLMQGDLYVVRKGESFFIDGDSSFTYFYICFQGRRAVELMERVGLVNHICVYHTSANAQNIASFGLQCLELAEKKNSDLLSESLLLYMLAQFEHLQKPTNSLILQMIEQTNEYFTNVSFSLSALSERLGYHPKYLSRVFKKQMGMDYTKYLRNLRIRHAIFLIEQNVVSVKNIAILSGFEDALYFSKVFKQETGFSPKFYIENYQQNRPID